VKEPTITVSRSQRELSPAERSFWGAAALVTTPGHETTSTAGHIRAEVWADGFVCLCMSDPSLIAPALATLTGARPVTRPTADLPTDPVMMEHSGSAFLGRVTIEFSRRGEAPVVGAFGSESGELVRLTADRLKQIA